MDKLSLLLFCSLVGVPQEFVRYFDELVEWADPSPGSLDLSFFFPSSA